MGLFTATDLPLREVAMVRNEAREAQLLAQMDTALGEDDRGDNIHASDLMDPLQAWWKKKDPQPRTDKQILYFTMGRQLHAFILGAAKDGLFQIKETDSGSTFSEEYKIWYSPDHLESQVGTVLAEFKTSRFGREPKEIFDIDHYTEQLLIYMAMEDRLEAEVWVMYFGLNITPGRPKKQTPAVRVFTIKVTAEYLEEVKAWVVDTRAALDKAIKTGNPRNLEPCRSWKCTADECAYFSRCHGARK